MEQSHFRAFILMTLVSGITTANFAFAGPKKDVCDTRPDLCEQGPDGKKKRKSDPRQEKINQIFTAYINMNAKHPAFQNKSLTNQSAFQEPKTVLAPLTSPASPSSDANSKPEAPAAPGASD